MNLNFLKISDQSMYDYTEFTLSKETSFRKLEARVLLGSKQSYRHGSKRDNDEQHYTGNKFTSGACCRLSL